MGAAYPELDRAQALIEETLKLEETRFRVTLARGLTILDDEIARPASGPEPVRRGRLQTLRHLWLPARPDPGSPARPEIGVTKPTFDARHGSASAPRREKPGPAPARPPPKPSGSPSRTRSARPISSAMTRKRPRAWWSRCCATARGSKSCRPAKAASSILNQTPFYAESGGQVGDTGALHAPGLRDARRRTAKKLGDLFVHEVVVEEGEVTLGAALQLEVDHERRGDPRQSLGHPSASRGVARNPRRPCRAKRLAGRARQTAFRLRPSQADQRPGAGADRGPRQSRGAGEWRGRHPLDGGGPGGRIRRPRPVRREIWRRSARRVDGKQRAASPSRSNSAAASMSRAPATSVWCPSPGAARSRPACSASRPRPAWPPAAISTPRPACCAICPACSRRRSRTPRKGSPPCIEERKKLERELTEARKKLAMGGGGAAEQPLRQIAGVKFFRPRRLRRGDERPEIPGRRGQANRRLRRRRHCRRVGRRQGRRRRGGDSRSHAEIQRRRLRAHRLGKARRQGRRRPPRHGPGAEGPTEPRRTRRWPRSQPCWSSAPGREPLLPCGRRWRSATDEGEPESVPGSPSSGLSATFSRKGEGPYLRSRRVRKASRSNMWTSCSFFSSAPCSGGISLDVSLSRNCSGVMSSLSSSFSQSSSSEVDGFFFRPGHLAHVEEDAQRLCDQLLLNPGKCDVDDRAPSSACRGSGCSGRSSGAGRRPAAPFRCSR